MVKEAWIRSEMRERRERDGHSYDSYDYNRKLFTHYSIDSINSGKIMAHNCLVLFKRATRERGFTSRVNIA